MTLRERIIAIRLIEKIKKNQSYAESIGLSYTITSSNPNTWSAKSTATTSTETKNNANNTKLEE